MHSIGLDELLVSIIMAVQNEELYLEKCLDSILAQTWTNWELIAVNDHSTDKTMEILDNYAKKDKRIQAYQGGRHKLIPILQEAYQRCQGMLINRMDADDYMPVYKLKVLVNEWMKHGKGTVIAGGTQHFVEEGEVGEGFKRYDAWLNDVAKRNAHYEEIYQECVIPSHCWIIHKEDFDAVGAFDPEVYPEDYDLCFRFYRKGLKIVGIDRILHHWRDHSVRISRTWDCYEDNRYFDLKLKYFYEIDRDPGRPLVLWGAGRNGKDLARLILKREEDITWVCDNEKKIGKDIYGIRMMDYNAVAEQIDPQILIAVNAPEERLKIRSVLNDWGKQPSKDYWFFT
jgi:glycosyltransferase involved in cell wall biosynthesis